MSGEHQTSGLGDSSSPSSTIITFNLTKLEKICQEEQEVVPKSMCANIVQTCCIKGCLQKSNNIKEQQWGSEDL